VRRPRRFRAANSHGWARNSSGSQATDFFGDLMADIFSIEELRSLRGTLGLPGTVAPFRAWRGSRDLVAQSPKFHDLIGNFSQTTK
jgi:hypothetical protein